DFSMRSLLRSLVSLAGQYDEISVTHEISVPLPKSNSTFNFYYLQSSRIELKDQRLGKRSPVQAIIRISTLSSFM
ncbi:hypothetical protein O0G73_04905, partial [Staphylococcus delphini]|uniref:hypothetical protein n=1 Tax=Staphylococcus delphini TaxID=53344 RepID=UPI0023B34568